MLAISRGRESGFTGNQLAVSPAVKDLKCELTDSAALLCATPLGIRAQSG